MDPGRWSVRLSLHRNFKQPVSVSTFIFSTAFATEPYKTTEVFSKWLWSHQVHHRPFLLEQSSNGYDRRHTWTPPSTWSTCHSHRVQGPVMSNPRNDTWGIYQFVLFCWIELHFYWEVQWTKPYMQGAVYCFSSCFLSKSLLWTRTPTSSHAKQKILSFTLLRPNPSDPTGWSHPSLVGGPTRVCGFNSLGARTWTRFLISIFKRLFWTLKLSILCIVSCCSTANS